MLQQATQLTELAKRSDQAGCLDHLRFFQSDPYFGWKQPLLMVLQGRMGPSAAVLVHEYRLAGVPLRLFIPADAGGERTVIAPAHQRAFVSCRAAQFLLDHGALVVMLSYTGSGTGSALSSLADHPSISRALRERTLQRDLPLGPTLDHTLNRMGAHTRRNLRACRRRAEREGFLYEPSVCIDAVTFLKMNGRCSYPVPRQVALWRLRCAMKTPGGFLVGLRRADGEWACLAGGRRYLSSSGPMTAIDWQMNRAGLARLSLSTTLRSYLLESELIRGAHWLRFEGGTPHSMHTAFFKQGVVDLVFAQSWLNTRMLRALGRTLRAGNLMGETLMADDVQWL